MIKLFGFTWLNSQEREEYKKLKKEAVVKVETERVERPYKTLRGINQTVICVLHDGTALISHTGGEGLIELIKTCKTESEIVSVFSPKDDDNIKEKMIHGEELAKVKNELEVFAGNPDFVVCGAEVYLKNVKSMSIPPLVVASFIEILEKIKIQEHTGKVSQELKDYYTSLKRFTLKLILNPILSSRLDLIRFVRNNDIKLTLTGNMILYRRANLVQTQNALVDFVSKEYFKIKKWKKSPKNYRVFEVGNSKDEKQFILSSSISSETVQSYNYQEDKGNLEELYLDLPNMKDNLLTDAHTGKKEIRVGGVYIEDEENIDINSRNACSRGLHCASRAYDYSGFGDTPLLVIVNPSKVRSVPLGEIGKMRVSEMFVASILEIKNGQYMDEDVNVVDLDEQYHNLSVEELEDAISKNSYAPISCQGEVSEVTITDMKAIKDMLKNRVNNI